MAKKWQKLAAKDFDDNIKMVSEDKFKKEVNEAQRALVAETLKLCGREGKINLEKPTSEYGLATITIELVEERVKGKRGKKTDLVQFAFGF